MHATHSCRAQEMERTNEIVRGELEANGQGHLLEHLDKLEEHERDQLYEDIGEVDLGKLSRCWSRNRPSSSGSSSVKDECLEPPDSSIVGTTSGNAEDLSRWTKIGEWRGFLVEHWKP